MQRLPPVLMQAEPNVERNFGSSAEYTSDHNLGSNRNDEIGHVVDADKLFVISTEITNEKIFFLRNEDFRALRRKVLAFQTPYGLRFREVEEIYNCHDPTDTSKSDLFREMFAMEAVSAFNDGLLLLVSLKRITP